MSAKFFIYAGRRWRELETESGRLSGWGRAKFVFLRHGRLVVARRGPVLRALRALATGRGVAARDGLPLRKYEPPAAANEKKKDKSPAPVSCKECQRHHEHVVLPQHCTQSTHVNSGPGGSSGGGKVRGGGMREYSALEDAAIVSWIRAGNRARLVNGNRLWRELQTEYPELTGQVRSWHSLRNRYLRYILPALQHFALPRDATRLRADAAAGELKSRKPQSQNSMLVLPRVRSALARRHRTRRLIARSTTTPSPMPTPCPTRSHRQARPNASTPKSPEKSTLPKRTPMYSELTRHFANVNDENSSDDFERTEAKAYPRERTSPIYRLRGRATPQSISTAESRSQRYSRRSTRNNTNKQPSPDHSLKEDAPRKRRRLYNPTTVL